MCVCVSVCVCVCVCRYYTEKFSSTILAALITGTPLLADDRIMKVGRTHAHTHM